MLLMLSCLVLPNELADVANRLCPAAKRAALLKLLTVHHLCNSAGQCNPFLRRPPAGAVVTR